MPLVVLVVRLGRLPRRVLAAQPSQECRRREVERRRARERGLDLGLEAPYHRPVELVVLAAEGLPLGLGLVEVHEARAGRHHEARVDIDDSRTACSRGRVRRGCAAPRDVPQRVDFCGRQPVVNDDAVARPLAANRRRGARHRAPRVPHAHRPREPLRITSGRARRALRSTTAATAQTAAAKSAGREMLVPGVASLLWALFFASLLLCALLCFCFFGMVGGLEVQPFCSRWYLCSSWCLCPAVQRHEPVCGSQGLTSLGNGLASECLSVLQSIKRVKAHDFYRIGDRRTRSESSDGPSNNLERLLRFLAGRRRRGLGVRGECTCRRSRRPR